MRTEFASSEVVVVRPRTEFVGEMPLDYSRIFVMLDQDFHLTAFCWPTTY